MMFLQATHRKVRFRGEQYWLHHDIGDEMAMLSPLEHYDDAGCLLANPLRDISYAVVTSEGEIRRYRETIGTIEDLKEVAV